MNTKTKNKIRKAQKSSWGNLTPAEKALREYDSVKGRLGAKKARALIITKHKVRVGGGLLARLF